MLAGLLNAVVEPWQEIFDGGSALAGLTGALGDSLEALGVGATPEMVESLLDVAETAENATGVNASAPILAPPEGVPESMAQQTGPLVQLCPGSGRACSGSRCKQARATEI